ncbi:Ribosome maturation factor RimP [Candidatus Cyrtobacter comes]|uniref:Ribosome maturation factor RimP n=1 Tax=Candidatus Cyrtobacter comes TaxID=675776 RepID=A0ABU5L733_9RICK|nr:ribosome maturation factor RimP [Candidatus Cyrtobacter comes]MDZ5761942.1 Ribosome maturation factor RimP [Candidatus Cyrtobacter comes]
MFIYNSPLEKEAFLVLDKTLRSMGYEIIKIRCKSSGKMRNVQIMAELSSGNPITLDDCEAIHKLSRTILSVELFEKDNTFIEISSPGIDRPLTRLNDFLKFSGKQITLSLKLPVNGRRKFSGIFCFKDIECGAITLVENGDEYIIRLADIADASLVYISSSQK